MADTCLRSERGEKHVKRSPDRFFIDKTFPFKSEKKCIRENKEHWQGKIGKKIQLNLYHKDSSLRRKRGRGTKTLKYIFEKERRDPKIKNKRI